MKRWPVVLFALFALLALVETTSALVAPARVATDADWEAAAQEVRAGFHPGELIVFAPAWADPVGRAHLGDLVDAAMAGRSDADLYRRIWQVSIRGAVAPETRGLAEEGATAHGRVTVTRFAHRPSARLLHDFTAALGDARVTQQPADGRGDETPCFVDGPLAGEAAATAFRCSGTRVERRTLEIDYQPRRGVLVPVDGALVTRIEYPAAPLGAELVLYAGLHDYYARKSASGEAELALLVDGARLAVVHLHNEDGWRRTVVDTARFAGAPHAVRVEVRSAAPAWRNVGFHAESRGAP